MPKALASQRQPYFYGGIQDGMVVQKRASLRFESTLKSVNHSHEISTLAESKNLHYLNKLHIGRVTCQPNGGIWVNDVGTPMLVTETRQQGIGGNAIERFSRNYSMFRALNPAVKYLVFCTGAGFFDDNYPQRMLETLWLLENDSYLTETCWNSNSGQSLKLFRTHDIEGSGSWLGAHVKAALQGLV